MNLKYDNITISGSVAVGKNTLFDNLKSTLKPLRFRFRTTGQILRQKTRENIMPVASLVSDDFHRNIDKITYELLKKEKKWVIEGWLSGFVSRKLKKVLKVLLICTNDAVRIDRVANRDKITIAKATEYVQRREHENFATWKKIYGDYNFFDPAFYNLVIDTVKCGPLETVGKVLDKLEFKLNSKQIYDPGKKISH